MRTGRGGFTLIELMIVVAIIAVIAAIAIPGLLASQRQSNERNAASSLKTLSTAQADFRANDRDNNRIQDFWMLDVAGLYTLCPVDSPEPIRLIELSVAGADSMPQFSSALPAPGEEVDIRAFIVAAPKATYWYLAMEQDFFGMPYAQVTNGAAPMTMRAWFNASGYAFMAYPDSHSFGRAMYFLNEEHIVMRRACTGTVRPAGGLVPPGNALIAAGAAGVAPLLRWPTDVDRKNEYQKLD